MANPENQQAQIEAYLQQLYQALQAAQDPEQRAAIQEKINEVKEQTGIR